MQAVSANFLSAIAKSDQVMSNRVDVLVGGVVQQGLDLALVDGSVTYDRTRAIWRYSDVTVVNKSGSLVPNTLADLLAPNGLELQLWRGVPGELASLGIYVVEETEILDSGPEWTLQLLGVDRTARVQWANFEDTFVVPAGTNCGAAIRWIIASGVPGLSFDLPLTAEVTPLKIYDAGSSRWDAAKAIATDLGWELRFGALGQVKARPVPNPAATPPVFTFVEGEAGMVTTATRRLSRVGTANVAIITGENPSNSEPFRGVAANVDPTSPTYIGNPPGSSTFGLVVEEEQRTGITSTSMAQAAAVGKLRGSRYAIEEVDFECLPNAALEVSDVVAFTKSRLRLSAAPYVLQTMTIPLRGKAAMQATMLSNPAVAVSEL